MNSKPVASDSTEREANLGNGIPDSILGHSSSLLSIFPSAQPIKRSFSLCLGDWAPRWTKSRWKYHRILWEACSGLRLLVFPLLDPIKFKCSFAYSSSARACTCPPFYREASVSGSVPWESAGVCAVNPVKLITDYNNISVKILIYYALFFTTLSSLFTGHHDYSSHKLCGIQTFKNC